jgi:adenine-specific DNA-methyltransferase
MLVRTLLSYVTDKDSIVLDSYAGSGTTAQAVLDLNNEDDGNRRFILVQLPEEISKKSVSHQDGYRQISEITRERVRRHVTNSGYRTGYSCLTLGPAIDADSILSGKLPTYNEFAKYVYYLATGKNHPKEKEIRQKEYLVGKSDHDSIYLMYEQDRDTLKKMVITLDWARKTHEKDSGRKIVYAPACYLDDEHLAEFNIKFVSIPYNLFERKD